MRHFYIETYGCQMNVADSEVVQAILAKDGMAATHAPEQADIILINTCSIRENAELKVRRRIQQFSTYKKRNQFKIGILGCMAERLRKKLLEEEKLVDLIAGPDAYRDLPHLLKEVESGYRASNVILSMEESYADITPLRTSGNGVSAFLTIMRGCDNMCSFCIVPYTRGRERSRSHQSILKEIKQLSIQGYKEVTLLGQNVNSYRDGDVDFAALLTKAAVIDPEMRIRFTTPHPKDFPLHLLEVIANNSNVCSQIHIPAQSGNTQVLKRMRRTYTRHAYLQLINQIRHKISNITLSTDIIVGFCGETESEFNDTLSLMDVVGYNHAYMFAYSERERTIAQRKYKDDIDPEIKQSRLQKLIDQQTKRQAKINKQEIGHHHLVLVEGYSKRSKEFLKGRTDTNKTVIFKNNNYQKGQYLDVLITKSTSATLFGEIVGLSSITQFYH